MVSMRAIVTDIAKHIDEVMMTFRPSCNPFEDLKKQSNFLCSLAVVEDFAIIGTNRPVNYTHIKQPQHKHRLHGINSANVM